jgi:hypothetical protein
MRIIALYVGGLVLATVISFATVAMRAPAFHARIGTNLETLSWGTDFYPSVLFGRNFSRLDNHNDAIMTQLSMDNPRLPFVQQVFNPRMVRAYFDESRQIHNQVKSLRARYYDGAEPDYEFSRYWHGYRAPLRFFGSLFTYRQLRVVNYIVMALLLTLASYLIKKAFNREVLLLFIITMVAISIYLIPLSLQFLSVFYILLVAISALCAMLLRRKNDAPVAELVAVAAMAAAFFDLLTAPLIIIGILSTLYAVWLYRDRATSPSTVMRSVCGLYALWFIVYIAFWAAKPVIARLFGVTGVATSISEQVVKYFTFASTQDWINAISYNLATFMGASSLDTNVKDLYYWIFVVAFFVLLLLSVLIWMMLMRRRQISPDLSMVRPFLPLLAIAITPMIWWQATAWRAANHPFVYRELGVTIFALGMFYLLTYYEARVESPGRLR